MTDKKNEEISLLHGQTCWYIFQSQLVSTNYMFLWATLSGLNRPYICNYVCIWNNKKWSQNLEGVKEKWQELKKENSKNYAISMFIYKISYMYDCISKYYVIIWGKIISNIGFK